jgi:membrane protein DedA with SNARE-associated domain
MFERLDQLIVWLSDRIPLELFTFIGSFLEDVLAPIPSPLVTTTAGTIAFAQGYLFIGLFWLALIAAAGKTLGCIVIYIITDKAEDFFMTRLGPRLGVTHKEIENLGETILP